MLLFSLNIYCFVHLNLNLVLISFLFNTNTLTFITYNWVRRFIIQEDWLKVPKQYYLLNYLSCIDWRFCQLWTSVWMNSSIAPSNRTSPKDACKGGYFKPWHSIKCVNYSFSFHPINYLSTLKTSSNSWLQYSPQFKHVIYQGILLTILI